MSGSARSSPRARRIALAVCGLLVGLACAEIATRVADPLGVSYFATSTAYQLDKLADPDLVFRHAPGLERRYGDVLVTINAHGLRDRPIGAKAAGELRVLALGDSVTFGWGVAQDETFVAQLEPLLSARLARPVRAINAGVGSYNTVQEVAWFVRDGRALAPDLVLLTYVGNDTEVNAPPFDPWRTVSVRGKPLPDAAYTLLRKSRLYQLAEYVVRHVWHLGRPAPPTGPADPGWQASMTALRTLADYCDAARIPLVVVFFRWGRQDTVALYADVERAVAGHPVHDTAAWWPAGDRRALMISRIDTHPNATAHRLLATHIADAIVAAVHHTAADTANTPSAAGR